jgi:hypothetical protein
MTLMSRLRSPAPRAARKPASRFVARRLLHASPMRLALLFACAVTSGCLLYTGDLNHAPTLTAAPSTQDTFTGTVITFAITLGDVDDGQTPTLITPQVLTTDGSQLGACDYLPVFTGDTEYSVQFFRPGSYEVTLQARDELDATSTAQNFIIHVTTGPLTLPSTDAIGPAAGEGMCGAFTAGQGVPLTFTGTVADPNAPPTDATCSTAAPYSYVWTVTPVPGSTNPFLTAYTDHCEAPSSTSSASLATAACISGQPCVCVWPDYGMAQTPSNYDVELAVDNGVQPAASIHYSLPVVADQPPCITGADPGAGSYVVDPADPRTFATLQITGVADDLDSLATMTFAWSMYRDSDPTWRTIDVQADTYSPDYSIFAAGEHVRIRAEALDRTMMKATCDPSLDTCLVTSCVTNMCQKWMTWDLELR